MSRKTLLLVFLVSAFAIGGCNRPDGGLRDRLQDQADPSTTPVQLPEVTGTPETDPLDEVDGLLTDLDDLLGDLDASLSSESDWQLDVPEDLGGQSESGTDTAEVSELLSELDGLLMSFDQAIVSESSQQIDPP
jgi:hypothetical protein